MLGSFFYTPILGDGRAIHSYAVAHLALFRRAVRGAHFDRLRQPTSQAKCATPYHSYHYRARSPSSSRYGVL